MLCRAVAVFSGYSVLVTAALILVSKLSTQTAGISIPGNYKNEDENQTIKSESQQYIDFLNVVETPALQYCAVKSLQLFQAAMLHTHHGRCYNRSSSKV